MILNFYTEQIKRLKSTFGEKFYPQERVDLFWEIVKSLPENDFKTWVDRKILDSRNAPIGEDFRELSNSVKKRLFIANLQQSKPVLEVKENPNEKISSPYACKKCCDSGVMTARNVENSNLYTFVCSCPSGAQSHWSRAKKADHETFTIPKWSNQVGYESNY